MTVPISAAVSSLPATSLESMAARYARYAEREREGAIDSHVAAAIRDHRIDDLVFWHRVRFRARLLCAIEQGKVEHARARRGDQS